MLGHDGMRETDKEIVKIMMQKPWCHYEIYQMHNVLGNDYIFVDAALLNGHRLTAPRSQAQRISA